MNPPVISVVMGIRNEAHHLRRSIDSILQQRERDFEFIIVDDGSTDDSVAIVREYMASDPRVRLVEQPHAGLTRALIRGCDEARGKFIARQDADDISLPERLEKLRGRIESSENIAFVSSWVRQTSPQGDALTTVKRPEDPEAATHGLIHDRMGPGHHGSVMFRRAAYRQVGGYRAAFYYAQDSDLWLRLSAIGLIAYVPEVLYISSFDPQRISSGFRKLQKQFGDLGRAAHDARYRGAAEDPFIHRAETLRNEVVSLGESAKPTRRQIAAGCYYIASNLRAQGNPCARDYFLQTIRTYPLHVHAWWRVLTGWGG